MAEAVKSVENMVAEDRYEGTKDQETNHIIELCYSVQKECP